MFNYPRAVESNMYFSALLSFNIYSQRPGPGASDPYVVPPGCDPAASPQWIRHDPSEARPLMEWPAGVEEKEGGIGVMNYNRKETNVKGQHTASPRAVIPPPARKGSGAIPLSLAPR